MGRSTVIDETDGIARPGQRRRRVQGSRKIGRFQLLEMPPERPAGARVTRGGMGADCNGVNGQYLSMELVGRVCDGRRVSGPSATPHSEGSRRMTANHVRRDKASYCQHAVILVSKVFIKFSNITFVW